MQDQDPTDVLVLFVHRNCVVQFPTGVSGTTVMRNLHSWQHIQNNTGRIHQLISTRCRPCRQVGGFLPVLSLNRKTIASNWQFLECMLNILQRGHQSKIYVRVKIQVDHL